MLSAEQDGSSLLYIFSMLIKHYDLIHAEDGTGPSNLSSKVCPQLQRLGIVQDRAWQGYAQRVVTPWGTEYHQKSHSAIAAGRAFYLLL